MSITTHTHARALRGGRAAHAGQRRAQRPQPPDGRCYSISVPAAYSQLHSTIYCSTTLRSVTGELYTFCIRISEIALCQVAWHLFHKLLPMIPGRLQVAPLGMKRRAATVRCNSLPAGVASQSEVQSGPRSTRSPWKLHSGLRPA